MSLRSKIEAVIYAAEEPVTLAQLTGLFAAEALVERAAWLALAQGAGPASGPVYTLGPARFELGQTAEGAADEHAHRSASDAAIEEAVEHPEQVTATQPDGFASELEAAPGRLFELSGEADESKRLTRLREREAREEIRRLIDELIAVYDRGDRGMEIREIAGGYRVTTKPEYHDAVRSFVKSLKPPMKLSLQALETLAVIAYKQPVTAPEISEIRGVDSGGVLGSLISRKLVTTAGRKQVIGRPILYKTTKEFLLRFGLKDLAELPSMEEFEKMAGELVDPEGAAQLDDMAAAAQLDLAAHADQAGPSRLLPDDAPPAPVEAPKSGEMSVQGIDPAAASVPEQTAGDVSQSASPLGAEPAAAAPELAEEREAEELAASARASVRLDDESEPHIDLPGVTRDTAGKVNIDSVVHPHDVGEEGEL